MNLINKPLLPVPPGDDSWNRESELPPQPFDLWTRTNIGENLPFPITPLTETNFPKIFGLNQEEPNKTPEYQGTKRLYGRLYFNEGGFLHSIYTKYGIPPAFMDRVWGSKPRGPQKRIERFHPTRLLLAIPSMLFTPKKPSKRKEPKRTPQEFFTVIDDWVMSWLKEDRSNLNDTALWEKGLQLWQTRGKYAWDMNIKLAMTAAIWYSLVEKITNWWTGKKELAQDLITGLSGMYNAQVGPALWQMARTLEKLKLDSIVTEKSPSDALIVLARNKSAHSFNQQLRDFLAIHGHRCPNELELKNPRWGESPEQIIELISHYLPKEAGTNPKDSEKRQKQRRIAAISYVENKLDPVRKMIFNNFLKNAQRAVLIRDNSRYYMTKFIYPIRKLYAELGDRWTKRGWLQASNDIFFLTVSEVDAIAHEGKSFKLLAQLKHVVAERKLAYDYWLTVVAPDAIDANEIPVYEHVTSLQGTPASAGKVTGKARIVQTFSEALTLTKDDILVTQATDPSWTPVFPFVKGIVLEIGGQLSHGAIVAREYGIPAIVNVQGAMATLKDGQMITVDGMSGKITISK